MNIFEKLKQQQRDWLKAHAGADFDDRGYMTTLDANLRGGLSDAARREIDAADGQELGNSERPGKLAAPWSSSALVVNVFDFWRGRDLRPLAAALGIERAFTSLQLEVRLATGFSSRKANLDVLLEADVPLAIEAKFTEPFQGGPKGSIKKTISPTYLHARNAGKWHGLDHLRSLALAISERAHTFRRLDVPQLLKHTVALRRLRREFELLLLWYSPGEDTDEAREMKCELAVLHKAMSADQVAFRALTYQALFQGLRVHAGSLPDAADYLSYLGGRYFGGGAP